MLGSLKRWKSSLMPQAQTAMVSRQSPSPWIPAQGCRALPAAGRTPVPLLMGGPNIEHSPFVTAATPQSKSSSEYNVLRQSSIHQEEAPESACAAGAQHQSINTGRRGELHLQPPEAPQDAAWQMLA